MSTVSNSTLGSRSRNLLGVREANPPPAVERLVVAKPKVVKILVLGNSNVGKSQFIASVCGDFEKQSVYSGQGIDIKIKEIDIFGNQKKLQIWDAAGRERFRTITKTFYSGVDAFIFLYDMGDRQSFDNLRNWINDSSKQAPGLKSILVSKCEDSQNSVVTQEEAQRLADEFRMSFIECEDASSERFSTALNEALFPEEFREARARGAAIVDALGNDQTTVTKRWFLPNKVEVQKRHLLPELAKIVASYDKESAV